MDLLSFLLTRRSVSAKLLSFPGPSREEINTLLTIAARVPDHGKLAPWRFIVIEKSGLQHFSDVLRQRFADTHPQATAEQIEVEAHKPLRAPLIIAVVSCAQPHPRFSVEEQQWSGVLSAYNALLAAFALGYAGCFLTEWYAQDPVVAAQLGLKPEERFIGFIYIGTPLQKPEERPRPNVEAITSYYI